MKIKSKNKKVQLIKNDSGDSFYLISPGYFFNHYLYDVYQQIGFEIDYDVLLEWMSSKYTGSKSDISNKLMDSLSILQKRGLISVDGLTFEPKDILIKDEYEFQESIISFQ